MFLFGLWPSCAYQGCPWPAVIQTRSVKDGKELKVDICPLHILEINEALAEMDELRLEQDADLNQAIGYEENGEILDGKEKE